MKQFLTYYLLIITIIASSCSKDNDYSGNGDPSKVVEGIPTWTTFNVGAKAITDISGSDAERRIFNVWILVFDHGMYEKTIHEDYSSSPGILDHVSVTSLILSGTDKRFYAIVNTSKTIGTQIGTEDIITNFEKTKGSYLDFEKLVIDLGIPSRVAVPNLGTPASGPGVANPNIWKYGYRYNGGSCMPDVSGLLMTGKSNRVTMLPNITEIEAPLRNKISINVYRNIAQANIIYSRDYTGTPNAGFLPEFDNKLYVSSISSVVNLPMQSYLIGGNESYHPYYLSSTTNEFIQKYENIIASVVSNSGAKLYTPENIVKTSYRGNTSFIAVKTMIYFKNIIAFAVYKSNKYDFLYFKNAACNSTLFITFDDNLSTTAAYGRALSGVKSISEAIRFHSVNILQQHGVDFSATAPDINSELVLRSIEGASLPTGEANPKNKWVSYHTTAAQHGTFYDQVSICYYDNTGQEIVTKRLHFKIADYCVESKEAGIQNAYMWNRIDIKDPNDALHTYSVKRNHIYKITINGFKCIGVPTYEDLLLDDQNKLNTANVDVEIKVTDWDDGGNHDETFE
ncbi:MAG: fimbria major subunit [Muribaculaceae bacterium]